MKLTFQEVRQKNGRSHRWLIRHEAPHTHDGFYTMGKFERTCRYDFRTKELVWSTWSLKLNGQERISLAQLKQITEFMDQLL